MYPVWKEIAKLENQFLRVAMYTTTGEERAWLAKAFPHCYSKDVSDLCVPASALRQDAVTNATDDDEDNGDLWWDCDSFGIPVAFKWSNFEPDDHEPVPKEVLEQIEGTPIRSGITFEYMGERFTVVRLLVDSFSLGDPIVREKISLMVVAHSKFIDLTS